MQTVWTKIILLLLEPSDQDPHCLPLCKNMFEKLARIFSRQHKQTTFSDAVFLDVLRVNAFYMWKIEQFTKAINYVLNRKKRSDKIK